MRNIVTYNGSWLTYNGVVAIPQGTNPLNLPAYTMRFQFAKASYDPSTKTGWPSGSSWLQVSSSPNVWDFTYQNADWSHAFTTPSGVFGTYVGQFLSSTSGDTSVLGANTTDVTNMSGIFQGCSSLVSLAYFDTSTVTNMSNMLNGCSGLGEIVAYDTDNVTNMCGMFRGCSALAAPPYFDTSSVTDMSYMFYGCSALLDVPAYITDNVTTMSYMFYGCTSLVAYNFVPGLMHLLPLFNTGSVTNMSYMFYGCSNLSEVPAYNTSNVTNMAGIFEKCVRLPRIPTFNTSRVTNMQTAFYRVGSSLSNNTLYSRYPDFVLPLLDTSSVTNMSSMCAQAKMLSIPLLSTSSVTNMNGAFEDCTAVESGALSLYQQASSQATVPSHTRTFRNCGSGNTSGSAELAQIPSDWK